MTTMQVAGSALLLFVAGWCVVVAARVGRDHRTLGTIWFTIATALLIAAVVRLLGLDHRLSDAMRTIAHGDGLYEQRRTGQAVATSIMVSVGAALGFWGLRGRAVNGGTRLAICAVCFYLMLSLARIVSLHLVDAILYRGIGPLRINWLLEAILVGAIAYGAFATLRKPHCNRSSYTRLE